MKNQVRQIDKMMFSRCQLLMLCFVFSLSAVCLADTAAPEIKPAENIKPFGDVGAPNDGTMQKKPRIEDLGNERYRVGAIMIDKAKRLITIPGVMLPTEEGKAIEFIATMKQGYKSYESVLTLEADAFEFNLACILIGLDAKKSVASKYHFDPQPVKGDPVSIKVGWEKDGKQVEYDVIELLKTGDKKTEEPSVWSYTGSMFVDGERYLAQMDGVLIGLVHNPASIIEHKKGIGLGNYGAILVDPDRAPESGQVLYVKIQGIK